MATTFMHGAVATACVVIALFFIRFYRDSHDRLFVFFGLAFFTLAANYVALAVLRPYVESRHYIYVVRLFAFILIILGILDKNKRERD